MSGDIWADPDGLKYNGTGYSDLANELGIVIDSQNSLMEAFEGLDVLGNDDGGRMFASSYLPLRRQFDMGIKQVKDGLQYTADGVRLMADTFEDGENNNIERANLLNKSIAGGGGDDQPPAGPLESAQVAPMNLAPVAPTVLMETMRSVEAPLAPVGPAPEDATPGQIVPGPAPVPTGQAFMSYDPRQEVGVEPGGQFRVAPGTKLGVTPEKLFGVLPGTKIGVAPETRVDVEPGGEFGLAPGTKLGVTPGGFVESPMDGLTPFVERQADPIIPQTPQA